MKNVSQIDWNKAQLLFSSDTKGLIDRFKNKVDQFPRAKIILQILAAGGMIGLAAVSPGAPLAYFSMVKLWKSFNRTRLKETIYRFKKQRFITLKEKNDQLIVEITTKGWQKILTYKLEDIKIPEPKVWDKKWRLIIFDISNKKRINRDVFQKKIKSLGFYQLQESIYVYPFKCFDHIEFLRQIFGIGIEVKYILAEKIEDDECLRNHFRV